MRLRWSPMWQLSNEMQGIIMIGFSLIIFKLYVKNMLTAFVAPKMLPFLLISMVLLFLLGFFRLLNSNLKGADCDCDVCDENVPPWKLTLSYLFFLSPLVLFFSLSDYSLHDDALAKLTAHEGNTTKLAEGTDSAIELAAVLNDKKYIEVDDENYFQVMDVLNNQLDDVEGTQIVMKGFIYREDGFAENEAVIARYVMTHCIVDLSVYGYMLNGNLKSAETNGWYEIKGTVVKQEIDGGAMPTIKVDSIKAAEAPKDEYLYLF
ncbi:MULTISPECIES: TIGR03943 family putative permease subunit [Bacillaceae]|uniref:TIGR03943 family putative permease subunit n=1 Tax=Bacillaceae TaxID=186817 RepID=UPI001E533B41|nr:TIGR03943 family protein [Bacillus sp. Au-Bac7]MCE4047512.1 TIGR03943 family protein [Bacillus sp. Au-Bac7]